VPTERYISEELWRLEQNQVWKRVWQWACLEEDLPNPGSYVEYQVGDQSVATTG
jgi:phenylpropionate dioxygenase-like ring-hydroxylating dioxygenase large terminal subunit